MLIKFGKGIQRPLGAANLHFKLGFLGSNRPNKNLQELFKAGDFNLGPFLIGHFSSFFIE
ncbi:hypothetical protein AAKU67_004527 [Oxalobacteraceae bacterium GrIS 2.11]